MKEKVFEIYSEGYAATGDAAPHMFHGVSAGKSLREACDRFFDEDVYYDSKRLTYWGCKIFDNAEAAAEGFG